MDLSEAEGWIDLARRKGVYELHVGEVRFLLGPLPAASSSTVTKAEQEPEVHPFDLISNPPDMRPAPQPEGA